MVQVANQISLYQKMTDVLYKKAGFQFSKPVFCYIYEQKEKKINISDDFDGVLTINEYDSIWSPSENNLEVKQTFHIKNPSPLFGIEGITMEANKIGIAAHLHSKTSNFQKTIHVGIIKNQENPLKIEFSYNFPVASLRGNLELDFFLYLKESNEQFCQHATKTGMILSEGDILNLEIIIDGEGSNFPMSEFEDKVGPLWRLEKNWVESNIDTFDSSNINLSLNTVHPLFRQVKEGKTALSRALMGDIMIQAMSMIIQQVIIVEGASLEDISDAIPNSILAAVGYWISTFDIDISSSFSIMNSLRTHWDRQMIEGDER